MTEPTDEEIEAVARAIRTVIEDPARGFTSGEEDEFEEYKASARAAIAAMPKQELTPQEREELVVLIARKKKLKMH